MQDKTMDAPQSDMASDAYLRQLKATFEQLPNDINLYLFAAKGHEDAFTNANRQVIRAFRELSTKITLKEYDLDHELARKWNVNSSPTLLIAPEQYSIRWLGAPMGEEARTFLETLILVGLGKSQLSDQSVNVIKKIDSPRNVKVFVSPTCPYCPQEAVNAVKAAIEMPEYVSLEIIDIQCEPELANQYAAQSVPQAFANDVLIGQGAQPEEVFVLSLQKLEPQTIFIPDSDAELVETDLLIVGGGPAGLTAGIYAVRSGLRAAVVERARLRQRVGCVARTLRAARPEACARTGHHPRARGLLRLARHRGPLGRGRRRIPVRRRDLHARRQGARVRRPLP